MLDHDRIRTELDERGFALTGPLLAPEAREEIAGFWDRPDVFRKRVVMGRHGYGRGEYQYFADPLPDPVARLRRELYPPLAAVADRWAEALRQDRRWPATHEALRADCAAAGQTLPTPLMLRYGPGDYNRLHQDLYGEIVFPLQAVFLLEDDFEGGELVLVENRPRMQSQPHVVPMKAGEGVIFAVRERPVMGPRGSFRVQMRHGVSTVRSGRRTTLGIIFHDAG